MGHLPPSLVGCRFAYVYIGGAGSKGYGRDITWILILAEVGQAREFSLRQPNIAERLHQPVSDEPVGEAA